MSLVATIDRAVAFVRSHSDRMTRSEVEEFRELAEVVYVEAFRAGLADALPRVAELNPQLESTLPELQQVKYETKLNLPGDWLPDRIDEPYDEWAPMPEPPPLVYEGNEEERARAEAEEVEFTPAPLVYSVCAPPRWFDDMDTLRTLAEMMPATDEATPAAMTERDLEQIAHAVGDDSAVQVFSIANRKDWSGERKMQEILRLDRRFAGKDSVEWAKLLGVSAAAVRGYAVWKALRRAERAED